MTVPTPASTAPATATVTATAKGWKVFWSKRARWPPFATRPSCVWRGFSKPTAPPATLYWAVTGKQPPDAELRTAKPRPFVPGAKAVVVGGTLFGAAFLEAINWALTVDVTRRPQTVADLKRALCADHMASLNLQDALRGQGGHAGAGDTVIEGEAQQPLRESLRARARRFFSTLAHPPAWPLAPKMTLAMVAAALLPMGVTAHYNLRASEVAVLAGELRFVEQMAHSTAGRLSQFITDNRHLARTLASDDDFSQLLARGAASAASVANAASAASAGAMTLPTLVRNDTALTPLLIDHDGVVSHHLQEDLIFSSLAPLPAATQAALKADQRFRRDTVQSLNETALAAAMVGAQNTGHVAYHSAQSGREEIAGFAPVTAHDFVVGVIKSRTDFEAPLLGLYRQLQWSVALVGLFFTGLALRFARSIVRPIRALTQAAGALKEGHYDGTGVEVKRRDELGQLGRTFNVMIDVLRQRERERRREQ